MIEGAFCDLTGEMKEASGSFTGKFWRTRYIGRFTMKKQSQ